MKFRTMKMETPRDMPTHLLQNPEQYITRVGRILRKTSLDELPQIFQIFTGEMSIIGPRPALWNQFDLIEERDKYGANDVRPGLTGWAQINGRDELPIDVKARLDGEYVQKMGFLFDIKCMLGTILPVFTGDGVVEGGTGTLEKENGEK
jgi:O-antigen biosynthesis protein WbqP